MARRPRIHVPGGVYYVIERTSPGRSLFAEPKDVLVLEQLLAQALARMGGRALAYCWLPRALHLALEIETTPVGRLLQGALSHYARYVHERTRETGHLFAGHYGCALIEPREWLAPLIRYLHFLPVLTGNAEYPDEYEYTSHHAYLGARRLPWLDTRRALGYFARVDDRAAYARLMSEPPAPAHIHVFEAISSTSVLGSDEFKAHLPHSAREHRSALTLEQIIAEVATLLQIRKEDLTSKSRARHLSFARAVIAWHATERDVATLAEVARRLRRDPSTLSIGMRRQRAARPEWFTLDALRYMKPIAGPNESK